MTTATIPQTDIYSRITQKVISDLEKGNLTWRMPWSSEHMAQNVVRPLRWNDEPYTGINILVLWATAAENGFKTPYWMTYKQAVSMKANVKKGEKGTFVVYADKITKQEQAENGELETKHIPFLKSYTVFNASQIEGLSDAFYKTPEIMPLNNEKRIAELEQFFANTKADIYTGLKASYNQTTDRIQMPPFENFYDANGYYATLAHEITHWTKHPSRLNRDFGRKKHGDEGYAKEELVAELGACFLGADLGFEPITKEEHAAYIQSWLSVLRNDKRFIFSAASHAQKAVEYLGRKDLH
ncbi:MAG TPA: zincin-like metallopeptidase domain-containing protein [Bacteroidia bacterium]|nr:zincin-like metallopeptidase domain-containing protein [Bacteroidia bacterium]HRH07612.1 zincin-like metallopeptidase domain-containing protein [Bacteroidia bacterium]